MPTYDIQVTGKVQGVFFRASTQEKARELGLRGWVRNQPDKSVRIKVKGDSGALQEFINWCHTGPTHAKVKEVIINETTEEDFSEFQILR